MEKNRTGKYKKKVGLTGLGNDYNIYEMSTTETLIAFLIGFVGGFIAMYIMFNNVIIAGIAALIAGVIAIPVMRSVLFKKRKNKMIMQFRDMLDSLATSIAAGQNADIAFNTAYKDICVAHGSKAPIADEISIIIKGRNNNFTMSELLYDMAERCGIDDIKDFSDTFSACIQRGGSLSTVVKRARDIINDKTEVEMEIQTITSSGRLELNLMTLMPFLLVLVMGTGNDVVSGDHTVELITRIIATVIFVSAYFIGRKITDIKI